MMETKFAPDYRSDDPNGFPFKTREESDAYMADGVGMFNVLSMAVGAGDYHIGVGLEGEPPRYVRIRTSGSGDPRNTKVCIALRQLWEALNTTTEAADA